MTTSAPPLVMTGNGEYAETYPAAKHFDVSCLRSEPSEVYHAAANRFLSSHALRDFRTSPATYRYRVENPIEQSDAMKIGQALHTRVLEGSGVFAQRYTWHPPINEKTGKPYGAASNVYQEWAAEQTRTVITATESALIMDMAEAVFAHPLYERIFADGVPEGVAREVYCGVPCQVRIDWLSRDVEVGIVDFKSCRNLAGFEYDAKTYGYFHQLAFYRAVFSRASLIPADDIPVHIVACEKEAPHRVGVWKLAGDSLERARRENETAIARLASCKANDHWPTDYESVRVLTLN